jgi:hypothetical protein
MGDYPNFNSGPTSNFYDVKDTIRSLSLNVCDPDNICWY